jgi:hypothetical protein
MDPRFQLGGTNFILRSAIFLLVFCGWTGAISVVIDLVMVAICKLSSDFLDLLLDSPRILVLVCLVFLFIRRLLIAIPIPVIWNCICVFLLVVKSRTCLLVLSGRLVRILEWRGFILRSAIFIVFVGGWTGAVSILFILDSISILILDSISILILDSISILILDSISLVVVRIIVFIVDSVLFFMGKLLSILLIVAKLFSFLGGTCVLILGHSFVGFFLVFGNSTLGFVLMVRSPFILGRRVLFGSFDPAIQRHSLPIWQLCFVGRCQLQHYAIYYSDSILLERVLPGGWHH